MTEQQWLTCSTLDPLLEYLKGTGSERKLRLFACACCRRVENLLTDYRTQQTLETVERFLDGHADIEELKHAQERYREDGVLTGYTFTEAGYALDKDASHAASTSAWMARQKVFWQGMVLAPGGDVLGEGDCIRSDSLERAVQSDLVRHIFGNPFQPVTFAPAWRTDHTVGIATKMYDERNFDAMPILADALEDFGCDNPDILSHCREPGVHVRGCWVVDLVLGKE